MMLFVGLRCIRRLCYFMNPFYVSGSGKILYFNYFHNIVHVLQNIC